MNGGEDLDGKTVLINSNIAAFFESSRGCNIDIKPCFESEVKPDSGIPVYQGTSRGICDDYGFYLVESEDSLMEKVNVDLEEHSEFFLITTETEKTVQFHATLS